MSLSIIPEMIVCMCYILRLLCIKSSISLCLICIFTCISIKEITIVNPYMVIILLKTYIIAFLAITIHISKISYFYIRTILHYKTKAVKYCILSNTFNSHTCSNCIKIKISFCKNIRVSNITNYSDIHRSCFFTLFISKDNILNSLTLFFAFTIYIKHCCYSVLISFCNINNYCITL